eukprot:Tbor_TRINITY_DN6059_c0_g2::TRINITY_DN6059_c0_g2_i1::g.11655::m.11655
MMRSLGAPNCLRRALCASSCGTQVTVITPTVSCNSASGDLRIGSCTASSVCCVSTLKYQVRSVFDVTVTSHGFRVPRPRTSLTEGVPFHPVVAQFVSGVLASKGLGTKGIDMTSGTERVIRRDDGSEGVKSEARRGKESTGVTSSNGVKEKSSSASPSFPYVKFNSEVYDKSKKNLLISGPERSGKLTNLLKAGAAFEEKGLTVAYVTCFFPRVLWMNGIYIYNFVGLRTGDSLPILEQMNGMLRRHATVMEKNYESMLPSLMNTDVLLLDSVQSCDPTILKSIDLVAREVRKKPDEPFGGIHVLAAGNFWKLETSPVADFGGYLFQVPEISEWFNEYYFPYSQLQEDPKLREMTTKALIGELTVPDSRELEKLAIGNDNALPPTPLVDNLAASAIIFPNFPKQPAKRILPAKLGAIKKTDFGNFLGSMLGSPLTFPSSFGLLDRLTLEPGTTVSLTYGYGNIPDCELGLVESISDNSIVVNFPRLRQSISVPPIKFTTYHKNYPEIKVSVIQYPLRNRVCATGLTMLEWREGTINVALDGHYMTEVNDLGNLLSRMGKFEHFTITNVDKYLKLEGMVHEATRVYTRNLMSTGRSDVTVKEKDEEWCRNCKTHIPPGEFYDHWTKCLKCVRWCGECDKTIPLSKMKSHREKHQIVMCIDCALPVEWKNWETHRLTCGPMMREISAENELLPERTRQVAMQFGLDRRDLHTVKKMGKSSLPTNRVSKKSILEASATLNRTRGRQL